MSSFQNIRKVSVPKIRFKADDGSEFGEWEDKKLGEISKTFSGGTPQSSNKSFYEGTIPFIKSGEISKNTTEQCINDLALEKSSAKLVKKGDLLYALYGATSGQVAISQIDGAINQAVLCIRSELNTKYLLNFLLLKEEILTTYLQGGQGNLSASILKEIYISTPCLAEQTKIANFLSAVDKNIDLLKKEHELLIQYKKGMMQKLFSQQIRFKADDGSEFGEWENKTISEIAFYRRGSFPQPYGLPEWLDEGGFPFVQVYDVADNMLLKDKTKIKISQLAADQSVLAKAGTLIITLQGSIGRVAKIQYDAYVDRTLLIFQSYMMPINTDYFKYALYLLFNVEKEKADGGIIKTITKETLSKFEVGVPCLEEQTKIANFLSAIDQKIEVVTQQIEQAKQWKKGLLQQMFV